MVALFESFVPNFLPRSTPTKQIIKVIAIIIIAETKAQGLVSIPGALTPSEATAAHRAGADFVKLFPVSQMGGAPYVKALCAPLSHIRFLAVGGVKTETMAEFVRCGASGFGVGLTVEDKDALKRGAFDEIEARCRAKVAALSEG